MVRISYGITVCNEHAELDKLLSVISPYVAGGDEIVILQDTGKNADLSDLYGKYSLKNVHMGKFEGDFSKWKNLLNSYCSGDFIFQLDADEYPSEELLRDIHRILDSDPSVDLYAVPRKNTVAGLTKADLKRWRWVEKDGLLNWPDYQMRIFRNNGSIRWEKVVHEKPVGYTRKMNLPDECCLVHDKTIARQTAQNALYDSLAGKRHSFFGNLRWHLKKIFRS